MLPKSGAAARTFLMDFVTKQLGLRDQQRAAWKKEGKSVEEKENMPQDFLDKLMDAAEDGERGVTRYHCFMMSLSNIIAGSDTTAISLSSTLYYLIRNPSCLAKLRSEVTASIEEGRCTSDRVSYKESQDMRYLQACIKEALRMHPATGLPLWRVIPEGGAEICGQYFPAGSEVGLNTWVAHYDEDVWGKDAASFRPERWIEAEDAKDDHVRLKEMEASYMPVRPLPPGTPHSLSFA
jgi:cytochrome P450